MNERKYDPVFADQSGPRVTIMDVYRDHHALQANCYCWTCTAAKKVIKLREAECEDTRPG